MSLTDGLVIFFPFQGVAEFWLQNLLEDKYFKDGTLVVAPCNSPEQVPITFGTSAVSCKNHFYLIVLVIQDAHIGNSSFGNCSIMSSKVTLMRARGI